jgi:cytochrome P450
VRNDAVRRVFTPASAETLRPALLDRTRELMNSHRHANGNVSLSHVAQDLPVHVISTLLGIESDDDRQQLREWASPVMQAATLPSSFTEAHEAGDAAALKLKTYFEEFLSAQSSLSSSYRTPLVNDLLGNFSDAIGGRRAAVTTAVLLFAAGHRTTTDQMCNLAIALTDNGGAGHRRLIEDPDRMGLVIQEALRFDSSVQATTRTLRGDGEVVLPSGASVHPGEVVLAVLGAAGRHRAAYGDSAGTFNENRFAQQRDPRSRLPHPLSFGDGRHVCLGIPYARLQLGVFVAVLAEQPPMTLDRLPKPSGHPVLRGPNELTVQVQSRTCGVLPEGRDFTQRSGR